jgi:hypothetical protein
MSGLALRLYGQGLGFPAFVIKYGGSLLWGDDGLLASGNDCFRAFAPERRAGAAVVVIGVELFRLVHTPWLDAFRLTMVGALLLGRIFSLWDILAYGVGIAVGALLDKFIFARIGIATPHSAS